MYKWGAAQVTLSPLHFLLTECSTTTNCKLPQNHTEKMIKASGSEVFTLKVSGWFKRTWNQSVLVLQAPHRIQKSCAFIVSLKRRQLRNCFPSGPKKRYLCLAAHRHRAKKAPTPSPTVQIPSSSCLLEQHPLTFQRNCTELLHEHYFFCLKSATSWPPPAFCLCTDVQAIMQEGCFKFFPLCSWLAQRNAHVGLQMRGFYPF